MVKDWEYETFLKFRYVFSLNNYPVLHHNHSTNECIGIAHNRCNRNVRHNETTRINIFAHNNSFDATFLIRGYSKKEKGDIEDKFIGSNTEQIRYVK